MDLEAKSKQPGGSSTAFDNGAEPCARISGPGLNVRHGASRFLDGTCVGDTDRDLAGCFHSRTGKFVERLHAAAPATVERPLAGAAQAREERERTLPAERGHVLRRAGAIMSERNHELSVPKQLLEHASGSVAERNGTAFSKMYPESAPDNFGTETRFLDPGNACQSNRRRTLEMKKTLLGSIASVAIAVSAATALAGPLEDRVAEGEPIRLGFAAAAPWAHPGENGEPLGFVNKITIDLLEEMGHTNVEPVVTDWAGLIPSLMAGRVDIITGGMYILGARCENIDFSEPIGQFGNAFIVPEGNPENLQTYEDIKNAGVTMAAVAGYVNVEEAMRVGIPEGKIMQLPGITEVLAAVKSGRAAIGAMTAIEAHDLSSKTEGIGYTDTNALPQWTFNWVGIGFHPDDDGFRTEFNAAMPGYIGSEGMLAAVAQWDYLPANVPNDTTTEWACANR